jgi:hypothetical protein
VTYGAALPPQFPARSSGRHQQAEAAEGADRAAELRAAMPKAAVPSKAVEQAGHARSQCQRQGRSPRLTHRRCTSTCGLTTSRRSLEDLLAQSERLLTKEAWGAGGSGHGRKEGKYTLDAALDQPCKFHTSPGRETTHSTRQCRFMRKLERHARQIPGASQVQPAGGQEDQQCDPAGGEPDQDDDFPADVEQYHIFTTPARIKGTTFGMRQR